MNLRRYLFVILIYKAVLYVKSVKSSGKQRHYYYYTELSWFHVCQVIIESC